MIVADYLVWPLCLAALGTAVLLGRGCGCVCVCGCGCVLVFILG